MADPLATFMKILKVELEDLLEDIGMVERRAAERLGREEITEYVFKENDNLFRLEAESVRGIINSIDGIDVARYKNANDLAEDLDTRIRELVKDREDPEAVYRFFVRKLNKVRRYVDIGE